MPGAKHRARGTQVEQDLFLLDSKPVPVAGGFGLAARTSSDPLVLHHRLGHPAYRQLARLLRGGMVRGTSITAAQCEAATNELCEPCVMGKLTSLKARHNAGLRVTATRPQLLVHNDVDDVTDRYSAATPNGMRYFVSLLDEVSGLLAVVLNKHKSDAPAALRDMVTLLQRWLGHKVVYLRTERGGGDTSVLRHNSGCTARVSRTRTLTMNGSAERVTRTVMECVRVMMLASRVPASFGGCVVMATVHVHNMRLVAGKPCTPHEACYGSFPDIHHLRVWGCQAWVHDIEPSSKLVSRGINGVFVGYEEGGRAYQMWAEGRLHRRRSERVRKRVEFPDFVTLSYSARYESNSCSGSEREGAESRGSSRGAASQPVEPLSFSEAMSRPHAEEWGRTMDAEMASQHVKLTLKLVSRQHGMFVLLGRWVLKVKRGSDGNIVKYKARWVVTEFRGLVCQLQRIVYGLKQAPRALYLCLRDQLEQIEFRASSANPSLFSLHTSSGSAVHMLVYVDDFILANVDEAAVQEVKQQLQQAFDVHDLGQAAAFLRMRNSFDRAAGILRPMQQQYIKQLLHYFGLAECNPRQLPLSPGTQHVKEGEQPSEQHTMRCRELVGGLLWLSTCTCPGVRSGGAYALHAGAHTEA
ncbi:hypothetical protein QJQ45_015573 [Haematococcus lacustris]|nr:hypothetical protein QJQ45_015573 [Haematococcus lacustris]